MNWGNKLLAVFIVFGMLIGYLVYRCTGVSVDLVSGDYYKQELVYQHIIDGKSKASKLSSGVTIKKGNGMLSISLPAEMKYQALKGNILFYCPSDAGKDRQIILKTDEVANQLIPLNGLAAGHYTVKVSWKANNDEYFSEQSLMIP